MIVSLPPKLEALIREKVKTGAYRDESEVLARALQLLADYEAGIEEKRSALRGMIQAGIGSGPARDTDIDRLIDDLNAKFDRH